MFTPGLNNPNTALMLSRARDIDWLKKAETARALRAGCADNTRLQNRVLAQIGSLLVSAGHRSPGLSVSGPIRQPQETSPMHAIELSSLSKTYPKRKGKPVEAVVNLSLSIPAGQVFGFLGPNGAGKTTTIKMMCGLVTPTSGAARLNGYDVRSQRGDAMRQFGVVLEGTRSVYWRLSAWENLMYFGRLKSRRGRELKSRAEWLLSELDLWERRSEHVRELSRGMQQKVAIACALIADPPILLLDEPTLGLDVQSARTVKSWIRRLAAEQGTTVLLTTHQLDMAQELCDRVAIINEGRLVADRSVSDLLGLFREDHYRIRVAGGVDGDLVGIQGLSMTQTDGETVISGPISDQEQLHQILAKVRGLGLPLISVERAKPNLEDVFVKLLEEA